MARLILVLFLLLPALLPPRSAPAASDPPLSQAEVIRRSEQAIGTRLGDHRLTRADGAALTLSQFRGRPLAISLVYTACASVCPVTTQRLLDAVDTARRSVGRESFAVLTVGFDARNDTPARMAAFARAQGIDAPDWQVATADAETLDVLLKELGFSYREAAGGIEHLTQTTLVDADGRVYRQIYGDNFPDPVLVEPLKELVFGKRTASLALDDLVKRVKFLCTVYNPSSGAYEFDYAIPIGITLGGLSLLITGTIIFRLWRRNRQLLRDREQARITGQRGVG